MPNTRFRRRRLGPKRAPRIQRTSPTASLWATTAMLLGLVAHNPMASGQPEPADSPRVSSLPRSSTARPSGAVVGDWSDPARLEVRGAVAFAPAEIARELHDSWSVILAGHPRAPLDQFLTTLSEATRAGYLKAGFPEARIAARIDDAAERIVIEIDEGSRRTTGRIVVRGADAIAADVADWLVRPQPPADAHALSISDRDADDEPVYVDEKGARVRLEAPVWPADRPARCDSSAIKDWRKRIKQCFAESGYEQTEFNVTVVPAADGRTAELTIDVLNLGPPSVVKEIVLAGNRRDSNEEILKLLDIRTGDLLTRTKRLHAERRLVECGRFRDAELRVLALANGAGVVVELNVVEYDPAPPLGQPLAREEAALLRFGEWLACLPETGLDLVIASRDARDGTALVFSPNRGIWARVSASAADDKAPSNNDGPPEGEGVPSIDGSLPSDSPTHHELLVTSDRLTYFIGDTQRHVTSPVFDTEFSAIVGFRLVKDPLDAKPFSYTFGCSFHHDGNGASNRRDDGDDKDESTQLPSHRPPVRIDFIADPVACLALAHEKDSRTSWNGGELLVETQDLRLRIDGESGRLIEAVWGPAGNGGDVGFSISAVEGELQRQADRLQSRTAALPNEFDPSRPITSTLRFALCDEHLDSITRLFPSLAEYEPFQRGRRIAAVVRPVVERNGLSPIDRWAAGMLTSNSPTATGERFSTPGVTREGAPAPPNVYLALAGFASVRASHDLFPRGSWPATVSREAGLAMCRETTHLGAELKSLYESEKTGPIASLLVSDLLSRVNQKQLAALFARRGIERLDGDHFRSDYAPFLDDSALCGQFVLHVASLLQELAEEDVEALVQTFGGDPAPWLTFTRALQQAPPGDIRTTLPATLDQLWLDTLKATTDAALRERAN